MKGIPDTLFEAQMNISKMDKLKTYQLRRQSFELLKTTYWGKIYGIVYLLIGFTSIFLYVFLFDLGIIFSIILGIVTWFVVAWICDSILVRTMRIDKQLRWMFETQEGIVELKNKGLSDEEINKLKVDLSSLIKNN